MKLKILFISIFLLIFLFASNAQKQNYKELIYQIKNSKEDTIKINIYNKISDYFHTNNTDSANYYVNKALNLSQKNHYKKGEAEALRISGRINIIVGHYEKAGNNLFKALKLFEELNDTLNIGKVYASIAVVKYFGKNYDDALIYSSKAVNIYKRFKDETALAKVFNNIGLIYSDKNLLDSAEIYYTKAVEIAEKSGNTKIQISALGNSARNFMIKSEFNKAVEKFSQILIKAKEEKDYTILCVTYSNIATAYLNMYADGGKKDKNLLKKALTNAELSLAYAEKINSDSYLSYAYNVLSESYKELGDYKNAFFYLEKYNHLQNSIFNKEKVKAVTSIEEKYKDEKNKLLIENLRKEKKLDNERIKKQNTIIWIGATALFIIAILMFFLLLLYRSKRHALVLLDKKNKAILKQREEISKHRDKISEIAFELKKANKTKNKFFSIIAHDLKNPFQGIIGFSELIILEAEKNNLSKIKKFAENINVVSIQTFKLLENLLDYTRSQVGLIKYTPSYVKLYNLIEEVFVLSESKAEVKGVELINKVNSDTEVFADETMISTVFRNLISNAIKFTDKGGLVKITSVTDKDNVIIKVIDSGIGIKESDLPKLFKADLNFSTFGTQNEKGTGLGLVVCKDFVTKNKGRITVESEVGRGSIFTVTLPKSA